MVLEVGLDDAVDLVAAQLVQLALLVVEARELIALLSCSDLLLEQAIGVASASGELDRWFDVLDSGSLLLLLMSLSQPVNLADDPLADPSDVLGQL